MSIQMAKPSGILSNYIKQYWMLDAGDLHNSVCHQRIVPSGLMELYFQLGSPLKYGEPMSLPNASNYLIGQNTTFYDVAVQSCSRFFAVSLLPMGASLLGSIPLNEYSGEIIDLNDIGCHELGRFSDSLLQALTFSKMVNIANDYFFQLLEKRKCSSLDVRIVHAIDIIGRHSCNQSVAQLADIACLSRKQFNRVFTANIGLSPKSFMRVVRFQHALYLKQTQPDIDLSPLAYASNYYDQSQMNYDFKQLSGFTPNDYFKSCDSYSDYFN